MTEFEQLAENWELFFRERVKRRRSLTEGYVRYVKELTERDLPPIFELEHLSQLIGIEKHFVASVIYAPSSQYRQFSIPKRLGGERTIEVPSPALLAAQRWIKTHILDKIPIHAAAHGFVPSKSVVSNAAMHVSGSTILKMDLADFFPSVRKRRGLSVFLRAGYPPNVSFYLASLCFSEDHLPQGAATSPSLSNIIAKRLDTRLDSLANSAGLKYSRYADDMTFSGDEIATSLPSLVSKVASSEGFRVNSNKTRIIREGSQKIITGVSISSGQLKLPRNSVRNLKRDVYHLSRQGFFDYSAYKNHWDPLIVERLIGKVGFWLQIEPENRTAKSMLAKLRDVQIELDSVQTSLEIDDILDFKDLDPSAVARESK